jgi:hypothetical protein
VGILAMTKFILALGTKTARPTKDGHLLILAKTTKAMKNSVGEKTMAVDAEQNITLKISTMDDMNHSKGSIYGRELLAMTEEQMKEELKAYGVVGVERAMSMRDGNLTPNGLHIVIFDQRKNANGGKRGIHEAQCPSVLPSPPTLFQML